MCVFICVWRRWEGGDVSVKACFFLAYWPCVYCVYCLCVSSVLDPTSWLVVRRCRRARAHMHGHSGEWAYHAEQDTAKSQAERICFSQIWLYRRARLQFGL